MYNEPKYDEDNVNLGYLKKVLENTEETSNKKLEEEIDNLPKRYTSTPQPPYKVGDTWIKSNKIYTCINSRNIGVFNESDWVTESGATEIAETKNRIYISIPKNYHVGDIWILQSDTDHKAGKKGEILNAIQNSEKYNESHWVKDIKYGLISDINQIAEDLDEAIAKVNSDIKIVEGKITTAYYQDTVPDAIEGDLWYVTENVENYQKGKIYRYDGASWNLLDDPDVEKALQNANTAQITADKKIQSFYSSTEPTENLGVGDLWTDLGDKNKLYRYNGTNWVPIYDTRIEELEETTTKTSETVAEIQTDLGKITARVSTVEETTTEVGKKAITNVKVLYALGDSATQAPTGGWSETAPEWQSGKYMWQKTATTNGVSTTYSEATCIQGAKGEKGEQGIQGEKGDKGAKGDTGATGDTGIGVKSLEAQYYLSDSNTTQTGGNWKNTQDEWQSEKYYWTRTKITWTDNTVTYTEPELAEALNNANSTANEALNNTAVTNEKIAQLEIVDDEIKASVTKTETRLTNEFLTAEQVQALNDVNTANIELIKQQQTSASMTAEGLQVQINKIENDGVTKVKNTTVDISEEGVSIGKSDSEFSSTWNNTGTYFKSYGKNIAEYSKDGAIMEKATVKTQFRMLRLKFVERTVNNKPRVQGFWKKGE